MAKKAKRKAKSGSKKSAKKSSKKTAKKSVKKSTKKSSAKSSPVRIPTSKPNTSWAFVGTLPILGYLLCLFEKRSDMYAMYYARQGLALGIVYIVVNILLTLFVVTIPLLFVWNLICLVLWVISARNAFSGRMKPTPMVGKIAAKF